MVMSQVEVLRAACCIAGVDGNVCEKEVELLKQLAAHVGVGRASLDAMIRRAQEDRSFFQEQFKFLHSDPEAAMSVLFQVALSDGKIPDDQRVVLHFLADKLGMDDKRFNQYLEAAENKLDAPRP